MTSSVDAKQFYNALHKLTGVLQRCSMPLLENIHVDFSGDRCTLSATDLNVWMIAAMPAQGDAFSFTFKNTVNVDRACRYYDGMLQMTVTGENGLESLSMCCGGKTGTFPVEVFDPYPERQKDTIQKYYTTNAKTLYQRSNRVRYAAAESDTRKDHMGVQFQNDRLFCCDGYRLAVNTDAALCVDQPFMLPVSAMRHLRSFGDADVQIGVGEKYAVFSTEELSLHIRLMDGKGGIDLESAWPATTKERYCVNRKQLLEAVKYLGEFMGKTKAPAVFDRGRITLSGIDFSFSAEIPVDGLCDIVYGFNLRYMKDALEQLSDSETIQIGVSSPVAPILLGGGEQDSALVLPVRIRETVAAKAA